MIQTVVILLLLFLLGTGFPVAFAMLVAGSFGLYMIGGIPFLSGYLETTPLSVALSYELVTVPMFLLMAELVILSGIANSLFRAIAMWFGRVPGGLGIATAFAGAAFGVANPTASATLGATACASCSWLSATALRCAEPALSAVGAPPLACVSRCVCRGVCRSVCLCV